MQPSQVVALYERLGSVVLWEHGRPPQDVDPFTGSLRLSAGGPRKISGPMGEVYGQAYPIRGYLQSKVTTTFTEVFGMVDDRSMQLTVPSILTASIPDGIRPLPPDLDELYRNGKFVRFHKDKLMTRDRFTILGTPYIAKSSAVPIIEQNVVLAWRLLVAAQTL